MTSTKLARCLVLLILSVASIPAQGPACTWQPLGTGISGSSGIAPPYAVATQVYDDGTGHALFVGGYYLDIAGGVPIENLAKWDGSTWSAVTPGIPLAQNSGVNSMTVFDDGGGPALFVAGRFTNIGTLPASYVARYRAGSWSALGNGVPGTPSPQIYILVFDDGTGPALYVTGNYVAPSGLGGITRWNGTAWVTVGGGLAPPLGGENVPQIHGATVFDDGTGAALYVSGRFTLPNGTPVTGVVRWNGTVWTQVGGAFTGSTGVFIVTHPGRPFVFDDGSGPSLWVAGNFLQVGGVTLNHVARWDGMTWSEAGGGLVGSSPNTLFWATILGAFDDGSGPKLYVHVPIFTSAGGVAINSRLITWNGNTWANIPDGPSMPNVVVPSASSVFDRGLGAGPEFYVASQFQTAGTVNTTNVARLTCPNATVGLRVVQHGGAGSVFSIENTNLTAGHEYYNVFSTEPCVGSPGPYLGLCAQDPTLLLQQLAAPVECPPIHFIAGSSFPIMGRWTVPPQTYQGVCFDVTGGTLGEVSPVFTVTIQ